jgi:DnaK suppressor protein
MGETAAARAAVKGMTNMDQKKLRVFKDRLVLKKQEILEAYNKNMSYGKEADEEGAQDVADKATNSYTKEFLFSLSNSERDLLQLVDEALVRIHTQRYGTCDVCGEPMDRKRLEAVPWAKRCISCQQKQEQGLL